MRKYSLTLSTVVLFIIFAASCKKHETMPKDPNEILPADKPYSLNVNLHDVTGKTNQSGFVKFRQDPDSAKIITLETKVEHMLPNHEYLLQRAVDAINVVDGNCTSTSWLTLGRGLVSQTILTSANGYGFEILWRDVTAIPRGSTFDIHFQIVDASTLGVVLTSDCYQYTVR